MPGLMANLPHRSGSGGGHAGWRVDGLVMNDHSTLLPAEGQQPIRADGSQRQTGTHIQSSSSSPNPTRCLCPPRGWSASINPKERIGKKDGYWYQLCWLFKEKRQLHKYSSDIHSGWKKPEWKSVPIFLKCENADKRHFSPSQMKECVCLLSDNLIISCTYCLTKPKAPRMIS